MFDGLTSIGTAMPGRAFVVRNHAMPITSLTEAIVLSQMFPCQHIAIRIALLIGRPGPDLDLEHRIVTMHAEEVVYRSLGMILHLPALLHIDVIHQIDRPEIVVDIDELLIRTTKVWHLIIEQSVHLLGFRNQCRVGIFE